MGLHYRGHYTQTYELRQETNLQSQNENQTLDKQNCVIIKLTDFTRCCVNWSRLQLEISLTKT